MQVKYSLDYGRDRDGARLHLVRLQNGKALLRTSSEMVAMKLARRPR